MAILSYVHEIQTVYNVVQNPQMILLKGRIAPGISNLQGLKRLLTWAKFIV